MAEAAIAVVEEGETAHMHGRGPWVVTRYAMIFKMGCPTLSCMQGVAIVQHALCSSQLDALQQGTACRAPLLLP